MADLIWLIPALPLAGFLLLMLLGRRIGEPGAGWLATLTVGTSFVLSVATFFDLMSMPAEQRAIHQVLFTWLPAGNFSVDVGFLADPLSITMALFVTGIGALIHLYSIGYMAGDEHFSKFFVYLNLFVGSMLLLVLGDNLLVTFLGWEGVGLCSYLLISFWFSDPANASAGKKAFVANRVGDVGFLLGTFLVWMTFGSINYLDINAGAEAGIASVTAIAIVLLFFLGATGKSAQIPLFTWLPDAMAGPTPVSALIHAATMVTSGIFLLTRLNAVLHEASWANDVIAWTGLATALVAALAALAQQDIKKVLAYSTVSQLGYMFLAIGSGAFVAAVFHMITHAFFKALLFLGSGSVIVAMGHEQDMRLYGRLRKYLPITSITFMVGWLAISGIPPFSGFWSKDEILAGTGSFVGSEGANGSYHLMLVMLVIGAFGTAAYMTRAIWYSFYGEYRGHGEPHESGPRITIPLIILASLGAIVGFLNLPKEIGPISFPESLHTQFEQFVEPVGRYFPEISHASFNIPLALFSLVVAGLGVLLPYLYYWKGGLAPLRDLSERNALARAGKTVLVNKYYFDWLYTDVITGFVKGPLARAANWFNTHVIDAIVNGVGKGAVVAGNFVYENIDQEVVDGAVNAAGTTASETGGLLRHLQSGRIQQYAALFFAAAALLAGVFVVAAG
ncbi:MAG: NADH-quinone oxidoreductase subunit L [Microthrixaceae bacterium]